jgi:hypothetical protein
MTATVQTVKFTRISARFSHSFIKIPLMKVQQSHLNLKLWESSLAFVSMIVLDPMQNISIYTSLHCFIASFHRISHVSSLISIPTFLTHSSTARSAVLSIAGAAKCWNDRLSLLSFAAESTSASGKQKKQRKSSKCCAVFPIDRPN